MFGTAKTNALCAKATRSFRIIRRFRVGTDLKTTNFACPFHQLGEITRQIGLKRCNLAQHDFTGAAIKGNDIAFFKRHATGNHGFVGIINLDRTGTTNARRPHTTCHNGRVTGHATA